MNVSSDNFHSDWANSASASSSYYSKVSLEEYTSSIDSASDDSNDMDSDTEVVDDKLMIFNFYKTLSVKLSKMFSVKFVDTLESVNHLKSNYGKVYHGVLPTEIDFTKKSHCIGYLQRYAACHAAMVFEVVSNLLNPSSSDVLLSKFSKERLNVMFLGGGPGNDFVGFLTALYRHHHHLFDLDVTVVDKKSGWEDVFNETVENLRGGDCGKAGSVFEEVNITTTFISVDLKYSEEWDESMHSKLQNADILFFVKALSHIPDADKLQILKNVINCMKLESLIIFIDSPYPQGVFASLSNNLKTIQQYEKKKYLLGHKDSNFFQSNIDSCRAVVKVLVRCENDHSGIFLLNRLIREMNLM